MNFKTFHIALILLFIFPAFPGISGDFGEELYKKGNQAYKEGKFKEAFEAYQTILDSGYTSAALLYNLGNAAYKTNQIGEAIYYYEKAKLLEPSDMDVQRNLELARKLVTDKFKEDKERSLSSIWQRFLLNISRDRFAVWSIWGMMLSCFGVILFFLAKAPLLKRTGFYGSIILLLATTIFIFLSAQQTNVLKKEDKGIVITSKVDILSEPKENAKEVFILHEGAKVKVLKKQGEWMEIAIPGNNVGWIPASNCKTF